MNRNRLVMMTDGGIVQAIVEELSAVRFTDMQIQAQINRAMAGEHFLDGFIKDFHKEDAKGVIDSLLVRMNAGEQMTPQQFFSELGEHLAN